MDFWEQIDLEFKIASISVNHFIWQLGYEALTGSGPIKRYSLDEFKQLEYQDHSNIYGMVDKKYPFLKYWEEQIMSLNN